MKNVSVFTIDVVLRADENPEEVLSIIDARLNELFDLPPTEDEINRAIASIQTSKMFGLQAVGGFNGRAEQLQRFNHYLGEPDWLGKDLERYQNVTAEDIIQMMEIYLVPSQRAILFSLPQDEKGTEDLSKIKDSFIKTNTKEVSE